MRKFCFRVLAAAVVVATSGCNAIPETIAHRPASPSPPAPSAVARPANGAIFQAASHRPMFEDRRARNVGDVLTIMITEKTSASKSGANATAKSGSVAASVPRLFGIPATTIGQFGVAATSGNKFEEKGLASSSNNFSGTITVTVVEVLANGNLLVSGEKQIALDKGTEFVRFSGVVAPDSIAVGNMVSSTQVADARVEYRTNTRLDPAEVASQLTRFFLSLVPL